MKYAKIVEETMHQNHCRFNNTFYKPPKGLAMESPISLILTEIFMNDFENRILKGSRFWGMIEHWARYVDDIQETNAMYKNIKFTVKKRGQDYQLPGLDTNSER